jgi:hypothetical protein
MAETGFVVLEIDDAPAEVDKAAAWLKKREPGGKGDNAIE